MRCVKNIFDVDVDAYPQKKRRNRSVNVNVNKSECKKLPILTNQQFLFIIVHLKIHTAVLVYEVIAVAARDETGLVATLQFAAALAADRFVGADPVEASEVAED